tara:strand:+ start:1402 stop:1755 length:354 start_codon:yes stop_codon:yes gene_type:complete
MAFSAPSVRMPHQLSVLRNRTSRAVTGNRAWLQACIHKYDSTLWDDGPKAGYFGPFDGLAQGGNGHARALDQYRNRQERPLAKAPLLEKRGKRALGQQVLSLICDYHPPRRSASGAD